VRAIISLVARADYVLPEIEKMSKLVPEEK